MVRPYIYTAEYIGQEGRKFVLSLRIDGFCLYETRHKNMRALNRRRAAWVAKTNTKETPHE